MSTFAPTTKIELQAAVDAWCSDSIAATVTYGPIALWNVSAISDMSDLFAFKSTFNGDISGWNVGNVTTMYQMFYQAPAFNQPLNSWNISQVTNISGMFMAMNSTFNQPLNLWNVSQVTDMSRMFFFARAFNQPLDLWNVSRGPDMGQMFYGAATFNQPLNSWNVSQVRNMNSMFGLASVFNQPLDLWYVGQVTDMGCMFFHADAFNRPLNSWNVSQVTNMSSMFAQASAFDQPLDSWYMNQVTDMGGMFESATAFNQPLNSWNVSNVTVMSSIFSGAVAFNQPLHSWNVTQGPDMYGMFNGATAFNQPLTAWNVSNVTDMRNMFMSASAFDQNIRTWVVGETVMLETMFSGATLMLANQGAIDTPEYIYFNQGSTPPPTGLPGSLMPVAFVLPQFNASFELGDVLHILGEYTAPEAYALPTITLSMPASLFNDGLFQLELTDSYINTLAQPATEAVYHSEKITYYANDLKFPVLKDTADVLLKDLPVVNGTTVPAKRIRQRNEDTDRLAASMLHELAYQAIGVSLMDDQIDNGDDLKAAIDNYLTVALPAFVKSKIADANGKTQNLSAVSNSEGRDNVPRELFMQIVESCVGGTTGGEHAKSSRLNSLFEASNLAEGKYGIKFIAGDSLRFSITIAPHSENGVVKDIDYIVDGAGHPVQEARTVELIISMTA